MQFCVFRLSEAYEQCVNTINCTGKNVPFDLSTALGAVDVNKYVCSKDVRPRENKFISFYLINSLCKNFYEEEVTM